MLNKIVKEISNQLVSMSSAFLRNDLKTEDDNLQSHLR